jgi:DNA-binding NtrC family response regulator
MIREVWIVDDEQAICWALSKALERAGFRTKTFSNAEAAIESISPQSSIDAILMDMRMPGMDGFQATKEIKKLLPAVPVIMMTAFGDLASAVQAIEMDIFEYLTKPFDLDMALKAVAKAIALSSSIAENSHSIPVLPLDAWLGKSEAMQSIYKKIAIASKSDTSVLIQGPTGSGKESIASAIHRFGQRKDSPFLVFAPGSIPPIALPSEFLGGNVGTSTYRSGALELASDGDIYIDEVSDLSMSMQQQLLRALEQKSFTPLGASAKHFQARVIASSSRDLAALVAEGEFLESLRQRLSVFVIEIDALADRPHDILPLAQAVLIQLQGQRQTRFSDDAQKWLTLHTWPGNLRELQTTIQRALLASKSDCIEVEDLESGRIPHADATVSSSDDGIASAVHAWVVKHLRHLENSGLKINHPQEDVFGSMHEDFLTTVETPFLNAMMEAFKNNRAAVAAQLGLHRSTLRQKMRKYKIEP